MSEENHRIWGAGVGRWGARKDRRLNYRETFWVDGGNQIRRNCYECKEEESSRWWEQLQQNYESVTTDYTLQRLKVKGYYKHYIPPLTLNDQQRLTIRSGVLTGNDTRWRSASSGSPLPDERTLDPAVCSQVDPPMPQPAALWSSSRNVPRQRLTIFSSEYYQILTDTHLPTPQRWKAELAGERWV